MWDSPIITKAYDFSKGRGTLRVSRLLLIVIVGILICFLVRIGRHVYNVSFKKQSATFEMECVKLFN